MEHYYVTATERDRDCDRNAAIKGLRLSPKYGAYAIHSVEKLKSLADAGQLWVECPNACKQAKVRIFWSVTHRRWIATTRADGVVCDNLLSLPMVRPSRREANVTYFESCPI